MASFLLSYCLSIVLLTCCFAHLSFAANVFFEINLTWETGNPDGGQSRDVVKINGQFPGPLLNLTQGDEVEFVVHNDMPFDTTIHFHGIEQFGTPWSDGVPGVSQKPIASGDSFTYNWTASQYGIYWYHAHSRAQIMDGLYGPISIIPYSDIERPFFAISDNTNDIAQMNRAEQNGFPMLIGDWSFLTSESFETIMQESDIDITCVDSILVNGKGSMYCPGVDYLNSFVPPVLAALLNGTKVSDKGCTPPVPESRTQGNFTINLDAVPNGVLSGCNATNGSTEVVKVDAANGWASLNFIGVAGIKTFSVSVDEHPMWVYAVDGHYIEPRKVDYLTLYNGERYSAMIKLNQTPGDYTIRFANSLPDQIISGFAILSYQNGTYTNSTSYINYGGAAIDASVVSLNNFDIPPFPAVAPSPTSDVTHILNMGRLGTNWVWTMDGEAAYPPDWNADYPFLFYPNSTDAYDSTLVIRTNNGTWVDIILQVSISDATPGQPPHPIHKHSTKGFVIGSGTGTFNYSTVAEAIVAEPSSFNLVNPPYRDSFTTSSIIIDNAWLAFRYQVVNPGAFFLHCHVDTHLAGGMALALLDGIDVWPDVPAEYRITNETQFFE